MEISKPLHFIRRISRWYPEKIFWEIIAPKIEARFAEASVVKIFNEAGEVLVRRKYILPIKSIVEKYFVIAIP